MGSIPYTVAIHVDVFDDHALLVAARMRAKTENEGDQRDDVLLEDGETNVGACLIMLFDLGISPAGCKIIETEVN
jgi:hypothetical protein